MRAVSKSISFCSRPARVRITAPALRASARRCSTLPARLRAARVVARGCCCYGARSRASSEYKCAAAEQVHERKPTSSHHRMPRWPRPTETCKPWRARALAPIYGRVGARGGRPFATAKAAHRRSGEGRELEAATISARRRPIVRGGFKIHFFLL